MNYQIFLIYIILALIIALVVHLLFKGLYIGSEKQNNNTDYSPSAGNIDSRVNNNNSSTDNININTSRNNNKRKQEQQEEQRQCFPAKPVVVESKVYESKSLDNLSRNNLPNNLMNDDYYDDYDDRDVTSGIVNMTPTLVGNPVCDNSPVDHEAYRNNFFEFRSNLWQNSSQSDAVDNINDFMTSDDDKKMSGKKISDIYDSLTGGNRNKKCLLNNNLDDISQVPQYRMQGALGDYYTRDNWIYNEDRVMNGAVFYNGISGVDPLMDNQMAV